jgi:Tol biopolymer transport system component
MTRLTSDPELDGLPVWTPDGQRIVWSSQRAGGNFNLYWQRADGTGEVERLTDARNAGHRASSFTSDGKVLVFSTSSVVGGRSSQDLAMLSLDGKRTVTTLLSTMFDEQNGEVSPDGHWLAYESNESGQFQVYVRPFPSVDRGRWPVSVNGGRQPAWSRNGRELFYIAPDGALMSTAVNASRPNESFAVGTPVKLMDGAGYYNTIATPNRGRTYDVSLDGRFLRIKEAESEASVNRRSLVIVLDWTEELNRLVPKK